MKPSINRFSIILVISLVAILALVNTSEATCANNAVYQSCCNTANSQLNACYAKANDFACQCTAMKALRECYRQCPDDQDITNQGNSYETAVTQVCNYANTGQNTAASVPVQTQPAVASGGSTNQANPAPTTSSPPNQATQTGASDKKSFANPNNDGRQIFFTVILSIAALIMAF